VLVDEVSDFARQVAAGLYAQLSRGLDGVLYVVFFELHPQALAVIYGGSVRVTRHSLDLGSDAMGVSAGCAVETRKMRGPPCMKFRELISRYLRLNLLSELKRR
jgi:hypothetical protein